MIVGEAGVGKSVAKTVVVKWLQQQRSNGVAFCDWDGSSDELVRYSIQDKLRMDGMAALTPEVAAKFMLIVDEYHFMAPDQRRTVLQFCQTHKCNLLLIANRCDPADEEMFRSAFNDARRTAIKCQADFNTMMSKTQAVANIGFPGNTPQYFALFFAVGRLVFGEAVQSFRFLELVVMISKLIDSYCTISDSVCAHLHRWRRSARLPDAGSRRTP